MSTVDVAEQLQESVSPTKEVVEKVAEVSPKKRKLEDDTEEEVESKKPREETSAPVVADSANLDNEKPNTDATEETEEKVAETTTAAKIEEANTEATQENAEVSTDSFRQKFIDLFVSLAKDVDGVDGSVVENVIFEKTGKVAKSSEYVATAWAALYKMKFVEGFLSSLSSALEEVDFSSGIPEDAQQKIDAQVTNELSEEPAEFDISSLQITA